MMSSRSTYNVPFLAPWRYKNLYTLQLGYTHDLTYFPALYLYAFLNESSGMSYILTKIRRTSSMKLKYTYIRPVFAY